MVEGCQAGDLIATSGLGEPLAFAKMETDSARDLALLKPSIHIVGGFVLGNEQLLKVGDPVTP